MLRHFGLAYYKQRVMYQSLTSPFNDTALQTDPPPALPYYSASDASEAQEQREVDRIWARALNLSLEHESAAAAGRWGGGRGVPSVAQLHGKPRILAGVLGGGSDSPIHAPHPHSFTTVMAIACLFLFLTLGITVTLIVFCRRKNLVFAQGKSQAASGGGLYELDDIEAGGNSDWSSDEEELDVSGCDYKDQASNCYPGHRTIAGGYMSARTDSPRHYPELYGLRQTASPIYRPPTLRQNISKCIPKAVYEELPMLGGRADNCYALASHADNVLPHLCEYDDVHISDVESVTEVDLSPQSETNTTRSKSQIAELFMATKFAKYLHTDKLSSFSHRSPSDKYDPVGLAPTWDTKAVARATNSQKPKALSDDCQPVKSKVPSTDPTGQLVNGLDNENYGKSAGLGDMWGRLAASIQSGSEDALNHNHTTSKQNLAHQDALSHNLVVSDCSCQAILNRRTPTHHSSPNIPSQSDTIKTTKHSVVCPTGQTHPQRTLAAIIPERKTSPQKHHDNNDHHFCLVNKAKSSPDGYNANNLTMTRLLNSPPDYTVDNQVYRSYSPNNAFLRDIQSKYGGSQQEPGEFCLDVYLGNRPSNVRAANTLKEDPTGHACGSKLEPRAPQVPYCPTLGQTPANWVTFDPQ